MNVYLLVTLAGIIAWIVVAFVVAWPSGWAHLPLIVAVVALARAIVGTRPDEG